MQKKKKLDRLKNFVKQDVMVGSKIRQNQRVKDAIMVSNKDLDWQFTNKISVESTGRIFIKNY